MRRAVLALAALALLLAACGGIDVLPKPAAAPALYRLTALDTPAPGGTPLGLTLVVDLPEAPASLDTERIALVRAPLRFDYFADAAWTDRAPAMVQSLLVETLSNAGRIRVVARPSAELSPDAELNLELDDFAADYSGGGAPEIHVRLVCRLVTARAVIAVRTFEGRARPAHNDTADIVVAFNEAFHSVAGEVAPWTAAELAALKR
jgi:cholesterol transport system auxiliary component